MLKKLEKESGRRLFIRLKLNIKVCNIFMLFIFNISESL